MRPLLKLLCLVILLVGMPLLGTLLRGASLSPYLAFPSTSTPTKPNSFSWVMVVILCVSIVGVLGPFFVHFIKYGPSIARPPSRWRFPWWGWGGVACLLISWILAWSRFPWFQPYQLHTFAPLWTAYILVINALTVNRIGQCLLTEKPGYYMALFPMSAGFWWLFEYLNRFAQNWYYIGGIELSANEYFWAATISFSTVLPAVVATATLLATIPRLQIPFENWHRLWIPEERVWGAALLFVASMGLIGIGIWPDVMYPALWLSPLLMIIGLQILWQQHTILTEIQKGNWSPVVLPALAGLFCGFFWEMWNYCSLAQWKYVVPHVQIWQVFEMPVLGYSGYLPFGITCMVFVQFLLGGSVWPQDFRQFRHQM